MRLAGFAAVLAVVVLALPAGSIAGNHQVFTDAVGDDSGGYAPDIVSTEVTSSDNGDVTFKVNVNEQGGKFYYGDEIDIGINSDDNANTGYSGTGGVDAYLIANTENRQVNFELCYHDSSDNSNTCSPWAQGESGASDTQTGANSHQVEFNLSTDWRIIDFWVLGYYKDPTNASSSAYEDFGPDSGWYRFDMNDDRDNDGVAGSADQCPTYKGGKLDKDGDGCPPKLAIPIYDYSGGFASGSSATFRRVLVKNAGSAVTVTVRFAGFTTHRRGTGALPGVPGRRFPIGSTVTFFYTNPNWFGSYKRARITRSGGDANLSTFAAGCTAPGSLKIIPCPKLH